MKKLLKNKIYSNKRNLLFTIFIVSFIIRYSFAVIIILQTGYDGPRAFTRAGDDSITYDAVAVKILNNPSILTNGKIKIWGHWDNFYGIILGLLYIIFGRNFYLSTIFFCLLNSFIPVIIFLMSEKIFNRHIAILASIISIIKMPLIFLSVVYTPEGLFLPMLVFTIYFLTKFYYNMKIKDIILSAIFCSFLIISRVAYIYFIPFILLWILVATKTKLLVKIKVMLIFIVILISTIIGIFSLSNNKFKFENRGDNMWLVTREYYPFVNIGNNHFAKLGITPNNIKQSIKAIYSAPLDFLITSLKIIPLRIIAYFEMYQFGNFDPIYMVNSAKLKKYNLLFPETLEFYVSIIFLIGIFYFLKEKRFLLSPIFLILFYHVLLYAVILGQQAPRWKEVSDPVIIIIWSFGFYIIYKQLLNSINGKENDTD